MRNDANKDLNLIRPPVGRPLIEVIKRKNQAFNGVSAPDAWYNS